MASSYQKGELVQLVSGNAESSTQTVAANIDDNNNGTLSTSTSTSTQRTFSQRLQRLIIVIVVACLLAYAGEKASLSDWSNGIGNGSSNDDPTTDDPSPAAAGNNNSSGTGTTMTDDDPEDHYQDDPSDPIDPTDPTPPPTVNIPNGSCIIKTSIARTGKNDSSWTDRNLQILETSKLHPGRHWVPKQCTTVDSITVSSTDPYAKIQVDFTQVANKDRPPIMGFGGAFTEASALNYNSLSDAGKEAVMELLFGDTGLGYNMGRVHMNSCDFCVKSYSFDDVDGDFNLEHFDMSVVHDVETGMVGMMLEADAKLRQSWTKENEHGLNLVASPWSPPAWMKLPLSERSTGDDHAKSMDGSTWPSCLREGTGPGTRYADTWGLYFSKFLTAYKDLGIDIWAVTVQNEPEFPAPWEACVYTPDVEGDFIAYHLGPKLSEDHPDVKLLIFDHNKDHGPLWMSNLLDPSNPAAKYISGTGLHWYAGGMDRLLDGAVGTPNMHKMAAMNQGSDNEGKIILGTEACHCPSTYYAGGDLSIGWARAERYAHTVLADLAAGSNGWIEWNLVLDSVGGPNHLGNVCDAPILAVPHRATGAVNIPSQLDFEHVGHPFGPVQGDFESPPQLQRTQGFPVDMLEVGVVVQPMYYYMGHISRHVRPGARAVHAIVEGSQLGQRARTFRPLGSTKAGGGLNGLARDGIEVTMWPCEGSTRQLWLWNPSGQFQVFGEDWLGNPTTSCLSAAADQFFGGFLLTDCQSHAGIFVKKSQGGKYSQVVLQNSLSDPDYSCLTITPLQNGGGALGLRGGGQVTIGSCHDPSASLWWFSETTGELMSDFLNQQGDDSGSTGELCMTTGWPFLQVGAFKPANPEDDHTIVILNEADDEANFALDVMMDGGKEVVMKYTIKEHTIQTVLL